LITADFTTADFITADLTAADFSTADFITAAFITADFIVAEAAADSSATRREASVMEAVSELATLATADISASAPLALLVGGERDPRLVCLLAASVACACLASASTRSETRRTVLLTAALAVSSAA
jgi:uncharacterized protein YjbI with pentapeptide repeats